MILQALQKKIDKIDLGKTNRYIYITQIIIKTIKTKRLCQRKKQ
jgi:hypothetical protein